jgi:hypothetical protein
LIGFCAVWHKIIIICLHVEFFYAKVVSSTGGQAMTKADIRKTEARIEALRHKMGEISLMLDGDLLTKHNRVKRKDGSVHVSPEYYTFQYRGADGKRRWKRIPKKSLSSVKKLVGAAKRYRELEREYTALVTELSVTVKKRANK